MLHSGGSLRRRVRAGGEYAGERGADQRRDQHGYQASHDAKSLGAREATAWSVSARLRLRAEADGPAHTSSPFQLGGTALWSRMKRLIARRGSALRRYPGRDQISAGRQGRGGACAAVPRKTRAPVRRIPSLASAAGASGRPISVCVRGIPLVSALLAERANAAGCDEPHLCGEPFAVIVKRWLAPEAGGLAAIGHQFASYATSWATIVT